MARMLVVLYGYKMTTTTMMLVVSQLPGHFQHTASLESPVVRSNGVVDSHQCNV